MKDAKKFKQRIGFRGTLRDISHAICERYKIGSFLSCSLITTGYEDFNLALETIKGKYFVKIFAKFRSDKDCEDYIEKVSRVIEEGIQTPKMIEISGNYLQKLNVNRSKLRMVLMKFIGGQTIFHSREYPTKDEIRFLAKQAALINSIKIKPKPIYDSWAITNFLKEFSKKRKYLSNKDKALIGPLVKKFKALHIDSLPHCFVHGDIISTNIMRDNSNNLWIVDFSVSNYYPRIQELAVMACDLFFNPNSKEETDNNLRIALEEYKKGIQLTKRELATLPTYIELAHAMHILGASYLKAVHDDGSKENEYWLQRGRQGLTLI